MRKLYLLLTALILSLGLYSQTFPIAPTKGDGTKENPYQIETLAHLSWLSGNNAFWDKHFIQTADIDAIETEMWNDGLGFYPIGNSYHLFTGSYNGNHHKIIDLTINASATDYVGFFGDAENGSIEKLILENCNIEGRNNVGGIAGRASNVKFYQCSVTGTVKGAIYVGGFIGHSSSAKNRRVI